jgi:uncharacterized membrane protein YdjX (TVP38/TMEM64 family)
VLAVAVVGAILIPFLLLEDQLALWLSQVFAAVEHRPGLGAAIIIGLLAGDCLLPVPSSIVSAFAGAAFGWALGALVIWTGMTLGCVAAYALGASAGRVLAIRVVGEHDFSRATRLFDNIGPATLVAARAVPMLAEASTLAAGAARMSLIPFLTWTGVANAGISVAYAATGAAAASSGSFLIVFLGLVTVPAIGWAVWRAMARK